MSISFISDRTNLLWSIGCHSFALQPVSLTIQYYPFMNHSAYKVLKYYALHSKNGTAVGFFIIILLKNWITKNCCLRHNIKSKFDTTHILCNCLCCFGLNSKTDKSAKYINSGTSIIIIYWKSSNQIKNLLTLY